MLNTLWTNANPAIKPAEEACIRIGADVNLLSALAADNVSSKTVDQLADATRADPVLLSMSLNDRY